MNSVYKGDSIFWVETRKIQPNPFQPRREFNEKALRELAESIRQYGVLQPLVVTRREEQKPDGGISVYYELIAGERRLRAAKIAGLEQVPVIIRNDTDDNLRLELAIIENLQREDLNPIDRALAFEQLYKQFKLTHAEIGKKMGKSRVYVSNTLRLLSLPEDIKMGLISGKISEGHTRPLLMLSDREEEQRKLYQEIILKKLSVRDTEKIARKIAQDRVRKKKFVVDPRIREFEKRLSENLGTRVQIEPKENGGKILIDYFTVEDLENILKSIQKVDIEDGDMMERFLKNHHLTTEEDILSPREELGTLQGQEEMQKMQEQEKEESLAEGGKISIPSSILLQEEGILQEMQEPLEERCSQEQEEIVFSEKKEAEEITPHLQGEKQPAFSHKSYQESVRDFVQHSGVEQREEYYHEQERDFLVEQEEEKIAEEVFYPDTPSQGEFLHKENNYQRERVVKERYDYPYEEEGSSRNVQDLYVSYENERIGEKEYPLQEDYVQQDYYSGNVQQQYTQTPKTNSSFLRKLLGLD